MPSVSVIIPTYNRANFVLESIDSVLTQTYTNYEIIVVDDGSTDQTQAVLQPLIDQNAIRYVFQENRGESAARNHGIRLAQGEYIAFLDSDDLFIPTKLEKQVAYLDAHLEAGLVHSWYAKFEQGGRDLGIRDTSKLTGRVYPDYLLDWSILMAVPSVMVPAAVLAQVGGFDESIRWGPDLDMWRRITFKYPIGVVPEVLCKIRVHPGNISADKVSAAASFAIYLQKAFDDDPSIGPIFRRKALSKMYANVAHNILSAGEAGQMHHVRRFSIKAIRFWPLQFGAYFGLLGSFLGSGLRARLLKTWHEWRYPAKKEQGRMGKTILFLGTQMAIGGAQKVLFAQANWFHERGYNVCAVFFYDKEYLKSDWEAENPFPVFDLRAWRDAANPIENGLRLFVGLIRLWVLLRKEKVDFIETFTPDSNLLGLFVARLAGVKVRVASYHGAIEGRSPRLMRLHAWLVNLSFANTLVAVSEQVRRIAVDQEGIKPEKVKVILNGVEPQKSSLISSVARDQLQVELKFDPDAAIVLSVGRVTPQKGHTYLIDAATQVLASLPNTVFVIAGDGHLRESLVEKVLRLGLDKSVYFIGTRSDVPELLSAADLFVMPSLSEGMPVALLEAMVFGVPIVVSNLAQIAAFVKHKQHGLLVEPQDVNALSEAIIYMLENKDLRENYGKAGQEMVQNKYTVDHMCLKYEQLFLRESSVDLE